METTLGEIWKLLSRSQVEGPSRPPLPLAIPQKEKQWEELRTHLQQRSIKELTIEVAKVEIPPRAILAATPVAVKTKKT